MFVHSLQSVDGSVVFDMDPDVVPIAAGGTRLADDVSVEETALLARAMTYKFAVFGRRIGGAKAGIRQRLLDTRSETIDKYCAEIASLVRARRFLTGADLGTATEDFAALSDGTPSVFDADVDGAPFEQVVTGHGVVAAADEWLGGLDGRTVAIEGFGSVGAGVARAVDAAGGRIVGVSTIHGAVATADGLTLDRLIEARSVHGDRLVDHLGLEVHRSHELYRLPVDVLVPGARIGSLHAAIAEHVQAKAVVPAANVPYTEQGRTALLARGVAALPDFVCNGGAVLAHAAPRGLRPDEVLERVGRLIAEQLRPARESRLDPFDTAVTAAETFLATWVDPAVRPDGPAFAPEPADLIRR